MASNDFDENSVKNPSVASPGEKSVYSIFDYDAQHLEVEQVLNDHLSRNQYFLGDKFSAADVMLGGGLNFMIMFKMTPETPVLKEYCARITGLPAYKKMMERDVKK